MKLILLLSALLFCYIVFGSLAIYEIEHQVSDSNIDTYLDALWWTSETLTTIGYGQTIPISDDGKTFGIIYMWVGVGISGTIVTMVAKFVLLKKRKIETPALHEAKVEFIRNVADIESSNVKDIEHLKSLLDNLEKMLKEEENKK